MKMFVDVPQVYLHREAVDFRKSVNGLSLIVEQGMKLSPLSDALFVFCNKTHRQIKVLYWDATGFALWQKRLEQDRFKWPKQQSTDIISLTHEQWCWLLRGFDLTKIHPHTPIFYRDVV